MSLKVGDKTTILMHHNYGMFQKLEDAVHTEVTITKVERMGDGSTRYTAEYPRLVQFIDIKGENK